MAKRVEELEATVSELESTVRGLTEELVETKDRLRAIEEELDIDTREVVADGATEEHESSANQQENDDSDAEDSDDIIVA